MATVEAPPRAAADRPAEDLLALALARPGEALAAARAVLTTRPDPRTTSLARQAAGIVLRDRGELGPALVELRRALGAARRAGDSDREADVRATLGAALVMSGRTAAGLDQLRRAASMASGQRLAQVRLRWAHVLYLLGRAEAALPLLTAAASAFRRAGDRCWEARALANRCMCHLAAGATARAQADAERSGRLFTEVGQDLEAAQAVHNQALAAHQAGNLPQALSLLSAAARAYRAVEVFSADLAVDAAAVQLTAGLVGEAVEGLTLALGAGSLQPVKRAELELAAATARLATGDPAEAGRARELAAAAGAAFRRQQRTWWAQRAALVELRARFGQGERSAGLSAAAAELAAALRRARSPDAPAASLLAGRLALERGDAAAARVHLAQAARARSAAPALARATGWLAEALGRTQQPAAAPRDGTRAVPGESGEPGPGAAVPGEAVRRAGRVLRACGPGLDALEEHQQTLGDAELRALATGHGAELAALATRAALVRGPRELLRWTERWRATTLAVPAMQPRSTREPELAALRDTVRRLDAARAAGGSTAALERERQSRERDLRRRARSRGGAAGRLRASRPALEAVLGELGAATLVELVVVEDVLHVLLARAGRVRRIEVGPVAAAEREVDFARFALRRAAYGRAPALDALGARLQDVLLGPAAASLRSGTEPVVLVPPGRLHTVPWTLLPALRDRAVTVAPSAQAWLRARRITAPVDRRVALVAGPGLGTGGGEVPALAGRYPAARVLGPGEATVEDVLTTLDGAWLAHVAAHGDFRADSPLFSCLRLADGPLVVHDLARLAQPPYRLVLSACDAGVGAPVGADELLGLVTGLLAGGTAGVLASVSPVNDEAAVPVMLAVHAALAAGAGLAEALLAARHAVSGDGTAAATAGSFLAFGG